MRSHLGQATCHLEGPRIIHLSEDRRHLLDEVDPKWILTSLTTQEVTLAAVDEEGAEKAPSATQTYLLHLEAAIETRMGLLRDERDTETAIRRLSASVDIRRVTGLAMANREGREVGVRIGIGGVDSERMMRGGRGLEIVRETCTGGKSTETQDWRGAGTGYDADLSEVRMQYGVDIYHDTRCLTVSISCFPIVINRARERGLEVNLEVVLGTSVE